ncbi:DUF4180 domain-containing protein [Sphingobacterium psychroaquaticum]|uniref:DUF4180 domain-containing protein n=1 Tax=Sphingobacterium psychroaquaticum TaxID=561061 RepID=UPI00106AA90F|nr:DUF4180 domain-containing protein [Sphingobacterium psychroaquaticum]QBQ40604.1 DUF4180 domain-containing protein [Sphingobacterium psychroaquaticum]
MEIKEHIIQGVRIAELHSDNMLLGSVEEAVDLLGNMYYNQADAMVLYAEHIADAFFDLKTKVAGEILQKFSNYRMKLAIVGDFKQVSSKSLQDFIRESNKGRLIYFAETLEEALAQLVR